MPRVRNPIYDDPDRTDSVAIVVTNSIGAPINIALSSTWPPAAAMTGASWLAGPSSLPPKGQKPHNEVGRGDQKIKESHAIEASITIGSNSRSAQLLCNAALRTRHSYRFPLPRAKLRPSRPGPRVKKLTLIGSLAARRVSQPQDSTTRRSTAFNTIIFTRFSFVL